MKVAWEVPLEILAVRVQLFSGLLGGLEWETSVSDVFLSFSIYTVPADTTQSFPNIGEPER